MSNFTKNTIQKAGLTLEQVQQGYSGIQKFSSGLKLKELEQITVQTVKGKLPPVHSAVVLGGTIVIAASIHRYFSLAATAKLLEELRK